MRQVGSGVGAHAKAERGPTDWRLGAGRLGEEKRWASGLPGSGRGKTMGWAGLGVWLTGVAARKNDGRLGASIGRRPSALAYISYAQSAPSGVLALCLSKLLPVYLSSTGRFKNSYRIRRGDTLIFRSSVYIQSRPSPVPGGRQPRSAATPVPKCSIEGSATATLGRNYSMTREAARPISGRDPLALRPGPGLLAAADPKRYRIQRRRRSTKLRAIRRLIIGEKYTYVPPPALGGGPRNYLRAG